MQLLHFKVGDPMLCSYPSGNLTNATLRNSVPAFEPSSESLRKLGIISSLGQWINLDPTTQFNFEFCGEANSSIFFKPSLS